MPTVEEFISRVTQQPDSVQFQEIIDLIEENYVYSPAEFHNGDVLNQSGQNEGSCKIFAFARLNGLDEQQTLACFGDYYRKDVLQNPQGQDHQNIRQFIKTGWGGVKFNNQALKLK